MMMKEECFGWLRGTGLPLLVEGMILFLLAACNNETLSQSEMGDKLSFSFTAVNETRSRGEILTDYTGTDFGVFATLYSPEYSTETQKEDYLSNVKVTYNADGTCTTTEPHYWPNGDLHFSAYSPYQTNPADGLSITVPTSLYQGYGFSGKVPGRTDYMFADEQLGSKDDFTNGTVPVIFHHALTRVKFQTRLSTASEEETLAVKSLRIKNIRHTGSVAFIHNGISDYTQVDPISDANKWNVENMLWAVNEIPDESDYNSDYLEDYDVNTTGMTGVSTTYKEFDDCFYLMPQQLYSEEENRFYQCIEGTYVITKEGTEGDEVSFKVPLKIDEGTGKWTVNRSVLYSLDIATNKSLTLTVSVQPWILEESTNQFANTVTINNDGKIRWIEGTYNKIDGEKVVLLDDITKPAKFTFNIAGPLGGTWRAFFITKEGNPDAFTLSQSEGPVGTPCEITVTPTAQNTSNKTNIGELCFVVLQGSLILPVDELTTLSGGRNYQIVQNINK